MERVCAAEVCTVRSRADVKLAGAAEMAFQTAAAAVVDAEEHGLFQNWDRCTTLVRFDDTVHIYLYVCIRDVYVAGENEAGILKSRSRPEASFSRGRIGEPNREATPRVIRFSYKGLIGTIRCSVFRSIFFFFFGYLRRSWIDRDLWSVHVLY